MFFTNSYYFKKTLFHISHTRKKKGKQLAKYNINRIKNFNIFFMVVIISSLSFFYRCFHHSAASNSFFFVTIRS